MTAIVTADLHLNDNPRDEYRWKACDVINTYADKVFASHIFILGDFTDDKDNHSSTLVNRAVDVLSAMADRGRKVYVLLGNHDALDPANPFFNFISHVPDLLFVRETMILKLGDREVIMIPNGQWPDLVPECDLILTHATFKGASAGGFALEGIPMPRTDIPIISGDVHPPQTIGPVTYVGAPSLIDFGDTYKPRIIRIANDGSTHSVNIKSPGKRLVQARLFGDGGVDLPTEGFRAGDIIKVKVEIADDVSPDIIASGRDRIKKWAERNRVTLYGTDIAIPKQALPVRTVERRSDLELVRTYAANEGFDDKLTKFGERILARQAQ